MSDGNIELNNLSSALQTALKNASIMDPGSIDVSKINTEFITQLTNQLNTLNTEAIRYVTSTGVTNTYNVTIPNIDNYFDGLGICVKINIDSTGASTISINELSAIPIKKATGINMLNLKAGSSYTMRYNSTTGNFILQGEGASGDALASDLLLGKKADTDAGEIVGTIPSKTAQTYTPGTTNQIISSTQYLSEDQTILGDSDLISDNIKSGISIFNIVGKSSVVDTSDALATAAQLLSGVSAYVNGTKIVGTIPSKTAQTYTPGTTNQIISSTQYLSEDQTILGDPDLVTANIKAGINIFGINGSSSVVDTSDALATAAQLLSGITAYVNGTKIIGIIPSKTAQTYTPGTSNQTIATGQYLSGDQTILGDSNLVPDNILYGKNVFGVAGSAPILRFASGVTDGTCSYVNGNTTAWVLDLSTILSFIPDIVTVTLQFRVYGSIQVERYAVADWTPVGPSCVYQIYESDNTLGYRVGFDTTYFGSVLDYAHIPLIREDVAADVPLCSASWRAYRFS